jgi:hypothetical protein
LGRFGAIFRCFGTILGPSFGTIVATESGWSGVLDYLRQREDRSQGASLPEEKRKGRLKKKKGNAPQFDLRTELFRMTGTDLTQIDGIDVMTATTILSEAGWEMSKWQTEHYFVSWLRLCPDNKVSGDKIIGKGRLPTNNRITNALKMAASSLRRPNTATYRLPISNGKPPSWGFESLNWQLKAPFLEEREFRLPSWNLGSQ